MPRGKNRIIYTSILQQILRTVRLRRFIQKHTYDVQTHKKISTHQLKGTAQSIPPLNNEPKKMH